MGKKKKSYQKPHTASIPFRREAIVCVGSGTKHFLNENGTQGSMDAIERDGNASEDAAARWLNDEADSEDF